MLKRILDVIDSITILKRKTFFDLIEDTKANYDIKCRMEGRHGKHDLPYILKAQSAVQSIYNLLIDVENKDLTPETLRLFTTSKLDKATTEDLEIWQNALDQIDQEINELVSGTISDPEIESAGLQCEDSEKPSEPKDPIEPLNRSTSDLLASLDAARRNKPAPKREGPPPSIPGEDLGSRISNFLAMPITEVEALNRE